MFKRGDVILAPCRGDDGYELRPHWMVVIQVDQEDGAVYAVFTTSTKEGLSGGQYSFTDTERVLAGFLKPSRFPLRVMGNVILGVARLCVALGGSDERQNVEIRPTGHVDDLIGYKTYEGDSLTSHVHTPTQQDVGKLLSLLALRVAAQEGLGIPGLTGISPSILSAVDLARQERLRRGGGGALGGAAHHPGTWYSTTVVVAHDGGVTYYDARTRRPVRGCSFTPTGLTFLRPRAHDAARLCGEPHHQRQFRLRGHTALGRAKHGVDR
jgi:hypothetical protein